LDSLDADVNLVFIQNNALYTGKVEDVLFKATTEYNKTQTILYSPDAPLAALGCKEQYKFCDDSNCTTLSGIMPFENDIQTYLSYSEEQLIMFEILWRIFELTRLEIIIHYLDTRVLLADKQVLLVQPISAPLASDQWQQEVQNFFNTTMAMIQLLPIMRAVPPKLPVTPNSTYDMLVTPPSEVLSEEICHYQKIRTQSFNSISVLGLSLIIGIGSLIIIISLVTPYAVAKLLPEASQRKQDWKANGLAELARNTSTLDLVNIDLEENSESSVPASQHAVRNAEESPLLPNSSSTNVAAGRADKANNEITPDGKE
jgi:hypothetical protein